MTTSARSTPATLAAWLALLTACDTAEPVIVQTVTLEVTPADQRFGDVPVGVALERNVVVRNSGNAAWVPRSAPVVTGDGFVWRRGCDIAVAPGATCEAFVGFVPAAEAASSGTFSVTAAAEAGGAEVVSTVSFSGTGVAPTVTVSPVEIDFGLVLVGTTRSESVRIENTGVAEVVAEFVVHNDDNGGAGFRFLDGERTSVRLAPGAFTEVGVTLRPTVGGPANAHLIVELCGRGCGPSVVVTGRASAPRIEATPRVVDVGAVNVGAFVDETIHLENVGDGTLQIRAVELEAADDSVTFSVSEALPFVLEGNATVDVVVRYAPRQGRAALDAIVVVSSSDPVSPIVLIPVDGSTPGGGVQVLPEVAHFGRLAAGESRDLSMIVRSIGEAPVDVTDIRIEGEGYTLVALPGPTTLGRFESLQFFARATATPTAVDDGGSTARVIVAATGLTDTVATLAFLAGTSGCVPVPAVAHADLGFVQLRSGTTGAVVIDNLGDDDCILDDVIAGGDGYVFDADFSVAADGARLIAPGDSGTVDFGFFASRTGTRTAMVALVFAGLPTSVFVSASARGIDGELSVSPAALVVGPTPANCGDIEALAVASNTGSTTLTITGFTMTPADAPFLIDLTLPTRLVAGATSRIGVTAQASVAPVGVSTASVLLTTNLGVSATLALSLYTTAARATVTERFTAAAAVSAVDILFVVDNSGSMADDQQLLADNFASFFADALSAVRTQDFQIGVTTTDILSGGAGRGVLVGDPRILTRATADLAERFADNVIVGIDGTGLELGLEAMRLSLEHPENVGFIRNTAALSVVFISDEEDNGAFPELLPDPSLSRSPDEYIAILRSLKTGNLDNAPVLVSGVLTPGQASRYEAVVDAFNGTVLDISRPDWGEQLSLIGFDTFALSRTFALQNDADETSIVVTVDGRRTTAFSWDAQRSAVILDDPPTRGDSVVITYISGC